MLILNTNFRLLLSIGKLNSPVNVTMTVDDSVMNHESNFREEGK